MVSHASLMGPALAALVACTSPEPPANVMAANQVETTEQPLAISPGATEKPKDSGMTQQPKDPAPTKVVPPVRPKPPFQRAPTSPPAEVDPVRNVDITDPG